MKRPNFVSLFSGCGGFDLGFQAAQFRCLAAYDIDPLAVESHKTNLKSNAQVADLSADGFEWPKNDRIDVVVAGPPCQGFSTAGKRDFDDPRNHLLLKAGAIALHMKPRVFVAENVAAVASGKHAKYWNGLHTLFRDQGYQTASIKCQAETLGVPQNRTRMVMIAWNTGRLCEPELDTISGGVLSDALLRASKSAHHVATFSACTPTAAKIAARIKPGQKLSNVRSGPNAVHTWHIPEVFGATSQTEREVLEALLVLRRRDRARAVGDADPIPSHRLTRHLQRSVSGDIAALIKKGYIRRVSGLIDLTHTFNGKYRRLHLARPSLTVDTKFGDPRLFLHPTETRGFSVAEAAAIQGFPEWFLVPGKSRDQYRLIGNAVPPPMASQIARFVKGALLPAR
jgi:DNA (cytosine-5)-methyltransferase 1